MTEPGGGAAELPLELARIVAAWHLQDPDPVTRQRTENLLDAAHAGDPAALTELTDAFSARLQFGTAGLRGALGPGPNRMNRVVVGQAAAGLATYLLDHGLAGGRVLVGYDARHNSAVFARDTAEIMAGAHLTALLTDRPLPTPVIAYGIGRLDCVAAVVVTASHNPPQDNGYKVYLGDGSQIVPPADAEIAARIDEVSRRELADIPRADTYRLVGEPLIESYLNRISALVPDGAPRELDWVYTPLHGVGGDLVAAAVERAQFPPARVVARQADPDPDFPTVAFPNPEEPGAIDLAVDLARECGADLVVANDPDADRCAVAAPAPDGWRMLRGDELGALLGDDALRSGVTGTYACSIVSSTLLQTMATAYGQPFVATLTGFKWIGRVPNLAYGYEEAIGYCVDPAAVPDKDGMSALVRVLALAAQLRAAGLTLFDRLDEIERAYGVHATDQLSVRVADLSLISAAMTRLRLERPAVLAGERVRFTDLADAVAGAADGPVPGALPPTDAVLLEGESVRVVVRPSGTEPKLKAYLQVRRPQPEAALDLAASRRRAQSTLARLRSDLAAVLGL